MIGFGCEYHTRHEGGNQSRKQKFHNPLNKKSILISLSERSWMNHEVQPIYKIVMQSLPKCKKRPNEALFTQDIVGET
jgi:hypothetical protein